MQRRGPPPPRVQNPSSILYIGSLPFEWNESNLKAVVCGAGNVLDVRLGYDHAGKNKGYAFVEFETPQQAQVAMQTLGKVSLINPQTKQVKKLRIELSKEGFRTGNSDHKTIIPLNTDDVPPGVQFPPEILQANPSLNAARFGGYSASDPHGNAQPSMIQSPSMVNPGVTAPSSAPFPPSLASLPEKHLKASQVLPQVPNLPFATPDKINETLSQIPPAQLIELIANLKNIIGGTGSARAAEVFQISPHLATAATQALLLMGFINEEVIAEAMNAGVNAPAPVAPPHQQFGAAPQPGGYPPQQQQSPQGYGQPPQGQRYGSAGGQRYGQAELPPPPPPSTNGFQNQNSNQGRWPGLSLSTQMKLSNAPPDQVDMIVQVLNLTPEQISSLPPDRQSLVAGIRQQYM